MTDVHTPISARGVRIAIEDGSVDLGHVYVYILYNDDHVEPFALIENIWVSESVRGRGIGTSLVTKAQEYANAAGCYKMVCTSRFDMSHLHAWYERLGFVRHGFSFRK